jgi:hypothetical protein
VTGLTVPPGDPDRLGQAILRLVQDPVLRRTLGQQGRAHVRAHFDREQQVRLTEVLYLRALGLPGPTVAGTLVFRDARDRAAWQPVSSGAGPC